MSPAKAKRLARDKRFFKELQDQVIHDLAEFPYVDTLDCTEPLDPNDFILYSSPEISPLRLEGKCNCSSCLTRYADDFARGSCLYADVVVLCDSFSQQILRTPPEQWTPEELFTSITILAKLEPLMREGVIRFSRWVYTRCNICGRVGKNASERVAQRLLDDIGAGGDLSIDWGTHGAPGVWPDDTPWVGIHSPLLSGPNGPVVLRVSPTKSVWSTLSRLDRARKRGKQVSPSAATAIRSFLKSRLRREFTTSVDSAIFSIAMGRMSGASVVTDSVFGSRILSYLDHLEQPMVKGKVSELAPTKELPWIDGLDASGVIRVREEAHSALPSLRALIRSAVFTATKTRASALDDLRSQVAEVEAEFRALKIIRRRTNMIAAAGLLFGVAGYGTRQPATILAGLAGFLSALAAAHGSSTTMELREHALVHKPAYLLLKAKEVRETSLHQPVR